MKIVAAIIIYNRYHNLERWLRCWKECNIHSAELIVIHNDNGEGNKFRTLCESNNVKYILRNNIGFDIGAFQDVCRGRLLGFPTDWDYILWLTDDTYPMTKDFITPFIEQIQQPRVGCSCMKISTSVAPHIRTTGFMISKEVASRIQFPADPVTTKSHCYHFEHRGGKQTLTNQIRAMGLDIKQVAPDNTSPLWDSGYWKRLDRAAEHEQLFPSGVKPGDKVTFICTIFNSYPQIISSLLLQTHKNWELILIHDGPSENGMRSYIPDDARIKYIETDNRIGNWGHKYRQWALESLELGDYVTITNADNYYVPVFIEYMLRGFKKSHTAVATYCESMVHSYKAWDVIKCKFERGFIDCGGVMVKADIAKEIGWRITDEHSADWVYFSDIASKYSQRNFIPVKGALFVHN
jgi:hypothetical protein